MEKCDIDQECIAKEGCPYVLDKYAVLRNVNTDSEVKKRVKAHLRSLVCDKEERLFCCSKGN